MSTLRTSDGFEFETTRTSESVVCVCRRRGIESAVMIHRGEGQPLDWIQLELLEHIARECWETGMGMGKRHRSRRKGKDGEAR